ncbi:MAG: NADP-dependent phosphogluconate dehydrogenase [Pseudomonadales bacterium]|nr:NADP-dependent phosphogluconate dehydrogenase [Pseudomonadales bacterium]
MSTSMGLIGLGLMGANLADNLLSQNIAVDVFSFDAEEMRVFRAQRAGALTHQPAESADSLTAFIQQLTRPRKILLMVTAGEAVDQVIDQLVPLLDPADIIIDGGNSYFEDTIRRYEKLRQRQIHFIGAGISGGAEGARNGACLMIGGDAKPFAECAPLFAALAAKIDQDSCCLLVGPDGAGHFVKMVHNGIEYAVMLLIAECYQFMRDQLDMRNGAMQQVFQQWNDGPLASYLMDITGHILGTVDDISGQDLIDVISDKAKQKGTGQWSVSQAMALGVPVPTIATAVSERNMSSQKIPRQQAAEHYTGLVLAGPSLASDSIDWLAMLEQALTASIITVYGQGFSLLQAGASRYGWPIKLAQVAGIWRGGCIIRAKLLDEFKLAYEVDPALVNLLVAPTVVEKLSSMQQPWRKLVASATMQGQSMPAMAASLAYFESYCSARLPTNMIQAQRDFFGTHGFERIDSEGQFHGQWPAAEKPVKN